MIQKTLIAFKPDAVKRGICGEILARFEKAGLKIVATKMMSPNKDFFFHHYETIGTMISRRGQKAFDITLELMTSGPVIAMILEGSEAVDVVRKMVGSTEPKSALPGTVRGDYAHVSYGHADEKDTYIANLLHASGNAQEAELEIKHWFKEDEIFSYKRFDDSVMI